MREGDLSPASCRGELIEVDDHISEFKQVDPSCGASEHRTDPRNQFFEIERLRDVVVGSKVQSPDFVAALAARGKDDDWGIPLSDWGAEIEAALPREHHVQQYQVRRECPVDGQRLIGVRCPVNVETIEAQVVQDKPRQPDVVLDEQNASTHAGFIGLSGMLSVAVVPVLTVLSILKCPLWSFAIRLDYRQSEAAAVTRGGSAARKAALYRVRSSGAIPAPRSIKTKSTASIRVRT